MSKKLLVSFALLPAVFFFYLTAAAADPKIFGLRLGQKFDVPECKKNITAELAAYEIPTHKLCFERGRIRESTEIVNDGVQADEVYLRFPVYHKPPLISGYRMNAFVYDRKLEGIQFSTEGPEYSELILNELKKRYGAPTEIIPNKTSQPGSNNRGFHAVWQLPNLFVSYSTEFSANHGNVLIQTDKGHKRYTEELKRIQIIIQPSRPPNVPRTIDEFRNLIQWGDKVNGLQMSVSPARHQISETMAIQIALQNSGEQDVTLNLGYVLANGEIQVPSHLSLNFTDSNGKIHKFNFVDINHSIFAGRRDDYVVPLRAGSIFTLKLRFDQFYSPDMKETISNLPAGEYRMSMQFKGSKAKAVNLDMPGIALMNFWLGELVSNSFSIQR